MKVALFGGTGFVGSYIVKELINQGYTPKVLIRPGSENKLVHPEKCEIVSGDIFNENSINEVINDVDATIYNIGIIRQFKRLGITYEKLHFQGAKNCIDIAKKNHLLPVIVGGTGLYINLLFQGGIMLWQLVQRVMSRKVVSY